MIVRFRIGEIGSGAGRLARRLVCRRAPESSAKGVSAMNQAGKKRAKNEVLKGSDIFSA